MTKPSIDTSEVRFFSGSSNPQLAADIAERWACHSKRRAFRASATTTCTSNWAPSVRSRTVLHRAVALAAGQRPPGRTADDARHRPQRRGGQRGSRHHPLLLLCPFRQKRRPAHLDHRPAGRRPAQDGRGHARDDHDAALAAGARLLRRAHRPAQQPACFQRLPAGSAT